jgi:hypothetical protein
MRNMQSLWNRTHQVRQTLGYPIIVLFVILLIGPFGSVVARGQESTPAQAGSPWPDTPTLLASDRAYGAGAPQISMDAQGRYHVVWAENAPGGGTALYYMHTLSDSRSWSSPEVVFSHSGDARLWLAPAVTIDSTGTLHVIIMHTEADGTRSLRYLSHQTGETGPDVWQGPQIIYTLQATGDALSEMFAPRIAVDSQNRLHLVWLDEVAGDNSMEALRQVYYGRQTAEGNWTQAELLDAADDQALLAWPDIAYTPDNRLHVVYVRQTDAYGPADLWYTAKGVEEAEWSPATDLTSDAAVWQGDVGPVSIAADRRGALHVTGMKTTTGQMAVLLMSRAAQSEEWSAPEVVAPLEGDAVTDIRPAIATDAQGAVHIAYEHERADGSYDILYARKQGSNWLEQHRVAHPVQGWRSYSPDLVTSTDGPAGVAGKTQVVWYTSKPETGTIDFYTIGNTYGNVAPVMIPVVANGY